LDRYNREVVSLAILADENPDWRPDEYGHGRWGCEVRFRYPVIKLLDYQKDPSLLEAAKTNPFAVVVRAHLVALETRKDADQRLHSKIHLIKGLYAEGYSRQDILNLFRFIDWLLDLPEGHRSLFWKTLKEYEEGKKMAYITSVERIGIEKGMEKEAVKFLSRQIVRRFQMDPDFVPRFFLV
jgi:hypothetical protein